MWKPEPTELNEAVESGANEIERSCSFPIVFLIRKMRYFDACDQVYRRCETDVKGGEYFRR